MANPFQKAKKEKVWTKVLMGGPSGAGKTYSALRMAAGLAKCCGSRVAAIDTEAGRLNYYAEEFDFDGIQLEEFTPEAYVEMINAAADAGYKVLIIDSITHEWTYCCDTVNKMPGNSFTNWGKMTPRHDRFMEAILQSLMHIICTVRGKDEYTLEEKNGKQTPKKIGMGYKQRDNTEYEYRDGFDHKVTHLLQTAENVVRRNGVKTLIFDNMTSVDLENNDKDKYIRQEEFIRNVVEFSKRWQVCCIVVLHPRKMQAVQRMGLFDLQGVTAAINLAHRVLSLYRVTKKEKEGEMGRNGTWYREPVPYDVIIDILKDRFGSAAGKEVGLYYDVPSKRFFDTVETLDHRYAWDDADYTGIPLPFGAPQLDALAEVYGEVEA